MIGGAVKFISLEAKDPNGSRREGGGDAMCPPPARMSKVAKLTLPDIRSVYGSLTPEIAAPRRLVQHGGRESTPAYLRLSARTALLMALVL